MKLLAVLVGHDVPASGPGVGPQHHAVLPHHGADGGPGLGHLGWLVAVLTEQRNVKITRSR